jgi:hypothetical protein
MLFGFLTKRRDIERSSGCGEPQIILQRFFILRRFEKGMNEWKQN